MIKTLLSPSFKLLNIVGPIIYFSLTVTLAEISEKVKDLQEENDND